MHGQLTFIASLYRLLLVFDYPCCCECTNIDAAWSNRSQSWLRASFAVSCPLVELGGGLSAKN